MTTIVTRAGKGSPLTHTEMDTNLNNLNTDKVETSGDEMTGPLVIRESAVASDPNATYDADGVFLFDSGATTLYFEGENSGAGGGVKITSTAVQLESYTAVPTEIIANNITAATAETDGSFTVESDLNVVDDVTVGGDLSQAGNYYSTSTGMRNRIINGDFQIAQRGTTITSAGAYNNNDDSYTLDRWTLLADGNDIVDVSRTTTVPTTGARYSIGLDVETANKKFGIIQFIERDNCQDLLGNTVTLSFKAKVSATTKLDNIKAAILAWSSTADSVTSDVVSAWNVEGTNPTLAANWTYENTPINLGVTTNFATYTITAAIDTASAANIAVFIWSDVTDTTVGDFVYITDVQLEGGSVATPFERRSSSAELALCQRYFEKSFPMSTAPAQNATAAGAHQFPAVHTSGSAFLIPVFYRVSKRLESPAVTFYNPSATNAVVRNVTDGADFSATSAGASCGLWGFTIAGTPNAAATTGDICAVHWTSDAEL